MTPVKIISSIAIAAVVLVVLYLVPTNEFFGISSFNQESPSPMMILENDSDEILQGFKITPVSCGISDSGLNESHFQITNKHQKDYDVTVGVSFTDNDSILYEKEISVIILANETTNQIHLSDKKYPNPICVVHINDWSEI